MPQRTTIAFFVLSVGCSTSRCVVDEDDSDAAPPDSSIGDDLLGESDITEASLCKAWGSLTFSCENASDSVRLYCLYNDSHFVENLCGERPSERSVDLAVGEDKRIVCGVFHDSMGTVDTGVARWVQYSALSGLVLVRIEGVEDSTTSTCRVYAGMELREMLFSNGERNVAVEYFGTSGNLVTEKPE